MANVDNFTMLSSATFARVGAVRSTIVFYKYLLGGDSTAPSGLYARLCHAFLVLYNVHRYWASSLFLSTSHILHFNYITIITIFFAFLAWHAVSLVTLMLQAWCPFVCNIGGSWSHSATKSGNWQDRIVWCLGYLHVKADLDRNILWSEILE